MPRCLPGQSPGWDRSGGAHLPLRRIVEHHRPMRYDEPLTPWPRLAQAWWVYGLWIGGTCLFVVAFVMRIRCTVVGRCGGPVARLADLDAFGGLPRMTTTVLFVA